MQLTKSQSVTVTEIPLYLLPQAIARQIRTKGNAVYRISVKRTHYHHYNISVRTKSISRELSPLPVAVLSLLPEADAGSARKDTRDQRRCVS